MKSFLFSAVVMFLFGNILIMQEANAFAHDKLIQGTIGKVLKDIEKSVGDKKQEQKNSPATSKKKPASGKSPPPSPTATKIENQRISIGRTSVSSALPKCPGRYQKTWTNCVGTLNSANGKYAGEFKNGKINGKCSKHWFKSGNKYVGECKNNKRHGQGTFTYADGRKYVGEFKKSKMNGQGTFTYPDGRIEKGNWKDNIIQLSAADKFKKFENKAKAKAKRTKMLCYDKDMNPYPFSTDGKAVYKQGKIIKTSKGSVKSTQKQKGKLVFIVTVTPVEGFRHLFRPTEDYYNFETFKMIRTKKPGAGYNLTSEVEMKCMRR